MNLMQKRHERVNYQESCSERRRLTNYLHAGCFRKVSEFKSIDSSSARAKGVFYFLAGSALLIGMCFVLF